MSAPQAMSPAFLRASALARHLGISRAHLYRHLMRKLTPHRAGGKVVVYDVAQAEALIRNGGDR
jgi:hypothetical protein